MKLLSNCLACSLLLSAWSAVSASAGTVLYTTDFISNATNGFTEGGALNGKDGWSSQGGINTFNVASNGELRYTANTFLRGLNAGTAFNVGDSISITASVKTIGGTTPGFDANIFRIGLTDDTGLGSSSPDAGVQLGANNNGNFRIGTVLNNAPGNKLDSIAIDTAFHTLNTIITKTSTANQFSVTGSFADTSLGSFTVTNSGLYNTGTVYAILQSQGVTNVGGVAVDSFSVELQEAATVVPAPQAAGIGLLGLVLCVSRRRRRS